MLIYHCCCLRAAVSIHAVEIEGGDAMLAECARECGAAIHRFGCVISHISNCSPSTGSGFGQWVCNLRAGNAVASGESRAKRRRVPGRLVRIGHFHSEYFAKRWTFRPSRDRPGRRRCRGDPSRPSRRCAGFDSAQSEPSPTGSEDRRTWPRAHPRTSMHQPAAPRPRRA